MRSLSLIILLFLWSNLLQGQTSPHGEELVLACEACHTTEGWVMIAGTYSFTHDSTDFPLAGQHVALNCKACHPTLVFSQAQTSCVSCHTDMHFETVGRECERCHTPRSWLVENISQIHRLSRFPLLGAHQTADCFDCHPSASLLRFEPLGIECIDCHQMDYLLTAQPDHVAAGFSTDCQECHRMEAFSWGSGNFLHDFFPLTQGHAIGLCSTCHTSEDYTNISADCISCHQSDFQTTNNPNHQTTGFSTNCTECHTTAPGWKPADFATHDAQFFPIYSGEHQGEWNSCTECHADPANYQLFSCTICHEHNQADMDDEHDEIPGYFYESQACYECHPVGSAEGGFNHNLTNFPLTGGHLSANCTECHTNGYQGTSMFCFDCHATDYQQAANPNHIAAGIDNDCVDCHTTQPGWKPASFDEHNNYYPLIGAHAAIAADCFACHGGSYNNTPAACFGCHSNDYNQTTNPPHAEAQFSTECITCHTEIAWTPSTFEHDATLFPIYSGTHQNTWQTCNECHTSPGNYILFSCIDCHEHNQADMDDEHDDVGGYMYNSQACFDCHPTGDASGGFNHNLTNFPLTGAHTTALCLACHENGYAGTTTVCYDCHTTDFSSSSNPAHVALGLSQECAQCHTTNPGWQPATFDIHNEFYQLDGAHATLANDCYVCHQGNYVTTPATCVGCHSNEYIASINPPHASLGLPEECAECHTTNPDWQPATFDIHNEFYQLNGAHVALANDCYICHQGNYVTTPSVCFGCHDDDYNQTNDPLHQTAQFPTECLLCHTESVWEPSTFNHDAQYFPIYSGKHEGEWDFCADCHTNPGNYSVFSCIDCHEHNQPDMDDEHEDVGGYIYNSIACLDCHPRGSDVHRMRIIK
jgi:hypothetical protein